MKIRFLGQALIQIFGLMYGAIRHGEKDADRCVTQIEYALPFDGEWYTCNGGITQSTSHSWEILPQRFAYDFIIVDDEGESCQGDRKDLRSYYCYGKDILAPADGVVVSVKNHFPDCRIMDDGQTDPDTPDIGGNRIVIKHASKEYSAICHLMPGSVSVEKGQAVKRGEVIAKCGNSGNTTEPHVHFQLQNTAHFYSCIGLRICFSGVEKRMYGKYSEVDTHPLPRDGDVKEGYIHRGLLVKNCENE